MRLPKPGSIASSAAIALVAIVSTSYLLFDVARVDWFRQPTRAMMVIPDAANLVPRSPILLSGVRVGQVTAVDSVAEGVEVRFDIDHGRRVPADSTVVIEALSALSEPYINFQTSTGAGPYIEDGAVLRAQSITTPKSIPELARTVTALLRQLDPTAIASIIGTFSEAFEGTETVLPEITHAADLLAATLISRAPQVRSLLADAQVPGPDVAVAGQQMSEAGPQWGEFGVKVSEVVDSLEVLLNARPVPEAYTTGDGLLPYLDEITDYVDRIGPDLKELFPVLGPLMRRAGDSLQTVDLSALIAQALHSVAPDGTVRLEVTVK
ncbi:MlaD family protein [Nocardia cyriacigeorgica]|uniref:MCE family protein n=1 Tax=Nocardia cyriacigeorgica TaxID=135487 RepID=A0A5R8NWT9_9NOCA|nr:MlaD family protein [Nocardia cyriacigeorgica]TLF80785.1 MCE family protein [Nocardia cyriacigeorgica]